MSITAYVRAVRFFKNDNIYCNLGWWSTPNEGTELRLFNLGR